VSEVQAALLIIAAFTGGAWVGSMVYRRQVKELLQITKDLVELFSGGGQSQKANIEAVVDFATANTIWHFSPDGSKVEDQAMEDIAKSLLRMDTDLRQHVMERVEAANEIVKAAQEKAKAEAKDSNGSGVGH
jgi:hypothetical protein